MLKLLGTIARNVFWVGLTVAVLAGGYFGFTTLRDNRATLEPVPVSRAATAVETEPLRPWDAPLPVRGEGFVSAEQSVSLATLAGGEIVYLHPAIASQDGRFAKDDILIRIDDAADRPICARRMPISRPRYRSSLSIVPNASAHRAFLSAD